MHYDVGGFLSSDVLCNSPPLACSGLVMRHSADPCPDDLQFSVKLFPGILTKKFAQKCNCHLEKGVVSKIICQRIFFCQDERFSQNGGCLGRLHCL